VSFGFGDAKMMGDFSSACEARQEGAEGSPSIETNTLWRNLDKCICIGSLEE
jgi:hypothetical protein